MAKKAAHNSDRSDPRKNKSLALRNVIMKMPQANFAAVAKAVKAEYGHDVKPDLFYALQAQRNMAANRKANKAKAQPAQETPAPMNTAAMWVEAIRIAKQLLKATGSVENATALLNAVAK